MKAKNEMVMALALLLVGVTVLAGPARADIGSSKHNLSASGPGTIKALSEDRVCRFCHVPHNANPAVPLWSHGFSGAAYSIYASTSIQGSIGQPNGSSKLCLSCHDGAFAVGGVGVSRTVPDGSFAMNNGVNLVTGSALIGTNLTDDHPVSLTVATGGGADPEIVANPGDPDVKYDGGGRVQCTSCHDPHDDTNTKFLVKADISGGFGSQVCVVCHAKTNWTNASHRNSVKLHGSEAIKAEACAACHTTHNALVPSRLLAGAEEGLCNTCHDGSNNITPAIKNVSGEFQKTYRHPLATAGKHNTAETFDNLNDALLRHSECEDCHNPHGAQIGTHTQGSSKIGAVLLGTWGMKPVYSATPWTEPISWVKVRFTDTSGPDMLEAYLCFKCHRSLAKAFNPNNPSYHAVAGDSKADVTYNRPGVNYINGWNATSRMTCTDCHASDSGGVKGPHGSNYAQNTHRAFPAGTIVSDPVLLVADWMRGHPSNEYSGTGGSQDALGAYRNSDNDLCFKCHSRLVYSHETSTTYYWDATVTGFGGSVADWYDDSKNWHLSHMRGHGCTLCHVPHGSNKPHLLAYSADNFDFDSGLSASTIRPGGNWNYITCHGGSYTGC